jgi:hypothetical protein
LVAVRWLFGGCSGIQAEFDFVPGLGSACGTVEQLVSMQNNRSRVNVTTRCQVAATSYLHT